MADLSILETTKRLCGIEPDDTDYDPEIIVHINSIFFVLQQLGVGPEEGYMILSKDELWSQFIGTSQILAVISYMGLRVRMLFDPPPTGPATEAMERQAAQLEWRLNIQAEGVKWEELSKIYLAQTESI
jgi:hypothetical protein